MKFRWYSPFVVVVLLAVACGSPDLVLDGSGTTSPFQEEITARVVVEVGTVGDGRVEQDPTSVRPGRPVTLTAVPALGEQFVGWSGDLEGSENPAEISPDTDVSITATFEPIPPIGPEFTINIDGPGTVSRISGPVIEGSFDLLAIPGNGARFVGWTGMVENVTNPVSLPTRQDNEITAHFLSVGTAGPVINVWGGTAQRFDLGEPQRWINIPGNVTDPSGADISTLGYSLNDGTLQPLRVGPDSRRLHDRGDFNIELDTETLPRGSNTLVIRAVNLQGTFDELAVTIDYVDTEWPLPYRTNWGAAGSVSDQAQVVDGIWRVGEEGITPHQIGYDRLVAIGDTDWVDYDARFTVRINDEDRSGYDATSEPFVGFVLRWPGHSFGNLDESDQPRWGYWPSGSLGGYYLALDGTSRVKLESNESITLDDESFVMEFGVTYEVRATVQTGATGVLHRLKVWPVGADEPDGWMVEVTPDTVDAGPEGGSLLLIAHFFDVTFGDVTVIPID